MFYSSIDIICWDHLANGKILKQVLRLQETLYHPKYQLPRQIIVSPEVTRCNGISQAGQIGRTHAILGRL